jgi:hypothetical protein
VTAERGFAEPFVVESDLAESDVAESDVAGESVLLTLIGSLGCEG